MAFLPCVKKLREVFPGSTLFGSENACVPAFDFAFTFERTGEFLLETTILL